MNYQQVKNGLVRILRWIRNILLALFVLSLFFVLLYKFVPVHYTSLMLIRSFEQYEKDKKISISHQWLPLSEISPNLVQAVVASEDNLFLVHSGFYFEQIEIDVDETAKGRRLLETNTISQQTAKIVFLPPTRSLFWKGLESYFTVLIEFVWGKERIMEVFLNSIETGDGIFGAEAAARTHFDTTASNLTISESALIVASLPNPKEFNAAHPSAYLLKRQAKISTLMSKIRQINFEKPNKNEKEHE